MPARLSPDRNRGLIIACGPVRDDERGKALRAKASEVKLAEVTKL